MITARHASALGAAFCLGMLCHQCVGPVTAVAQSRPHSNSQSSLLLDGKEIRIGMSRPDVVARFRQGYVLDDTSDQLLTIFRGVMRFDTQVGTLTFVDGKLMSVARTWLFAKAGDETEALWNPLFSTLANNAGEKGALALITTKAIHRPESDLARIEVAFENRSVTASFTTLKQFAARAISIEESIQDPGYEPVWPR